MATAGQRDRRIQVLKRVESRDASGAVVVSWSPAFKLWAAARDRTGRETLQAGQSEVPAWDIRFEVLYSAQVERTDRISYRGETWRIVHIDEVGRTAGMVLLCSRELGQ